MAVINSCPSHQLLMPTSFRDTLVVAAWIHGFMDSWTIVYNQLLQCNDCNKHGNVGDIIIIYSCIHVSIYLYINISCFLIGTLKYCYYYQVIKVIKVILKQNSDIMVSFDFSIIRTSIQIWLFNSAVFILIKLQFIS